jgi:hypothetical protein
VGVLLPSRTTFSPRGDSMLEEEALLQRRRDRHTVFQDTLRDPLRVSLTWHPLSSIRILNSSTCCPAAASCFITNIRSSTTTTTAEEFPCSVSSTSSSSSYTPTTTARGGGLSIPDLPTRKTTTSVSVSPPVLPSS